MNLQEEIEMEELRRRAGLPSNTKHLRARLEASAVTESAGSPAEQYVAKAYQVLKKMGGRVVSYMKVEGDHLVYIDSIDAETEGQGHGEKALKKLVKLADDGGITLTLDVSSEPGDDLLRSDSARLVAWYRWHGFQVIGQETDHLMTLTHMERRPGASPDDASLRKTLIDLAVQQHGEDMRDKVITKVNGLSPKDLRAFLRRYRS